MNDYSSWSIEDLACELCNKRLRPYTIAEAIQLGRDLLIEMLKESDELRQGSTTCD